VLMSLPFSRIHALKSIILPRPSIRNLILRKEKGTKSISGDKDLDCLRTNLGKVSGFLQLQCSRFSTLPTKSMAYRQRSSAGYCGLKRISVSNEVSPNPVAQFLPLNIGGDALRRPLPREKLSQHFPRWQEFAAAPIKDLLRRHEIWLGLVPDPRCL